MGTDLENPQEVAHGSEEEKEYPGWTMDTSDMDENHSVSLNIIHSEPRGTYIFESAQPVPEEIVQELEQVLWEEDFGNQFLNDEEKSFFE